MANRKWSRYPRAPFYLFVSPWVLGFLALTAVPLAYAFVISLTNFDGSSPRWRWVGFRNYVELFGDGYAWAALIRTIAYTALAEPFRRFGKTVLASGFKDIEKTEIDPVSSLEQVVDNRYRIVKPLGAGGMAEVYLAHDNVLQRDVALKVMSGRYAGDEEFVERFKREAQSAAVLSHPNIVSIYDRGESENGTYYIAMEYLSGGTLKDRILKRGAFPPRTAAAVDNSRAGAACGRDPRAAVRKSRVPEPGSRVTSGVRSPRPPAPPP